MESNRKIITNSTSKEGAPTEGGIPPQENSEGSVVSRGDDNATYGGEFSGRELLLRNNLAEIEKPNIYSLETEFTKTKKNRDFLFYLVFTGFILFLLVSTVGIANFLEAKSKQITIDITDFEDLRLKETLTAAAEIENELNRTTDELNNLQASYSFDVNKLQQEIQKRANDPQTADKKDLQKLLQQEKKRLETIQKQYEKQITQKQSEVAKLQEQAQKKGLTNKDFQRYYQLEMDRQKTSYEDKLAELKKSYEDKLGESKKSYEGKLTELRNSNATKVQTLEKQVQDLEEGLGKLGTVFNNEAIDELVNDLPKNVPGGATLVLKDYRIELGQENVMVRLTFNDIRARIQRFKSVDERLRALFASNPAAPALQYTKAVTFSLINDYEQLWWTLTNRVAQKNQTIGAYETALYAVLKEKDADGLVTDPQKRDQLGIILRKKAKIPPDTVVELYHREDNEYVGKIKLIPTVNGGFLGEVVELAKFKTVKPLDWFKLPED